MTEQFRLYLNDTLLELGTETTQFSRTLQVNDLVSIDNRQTNFTKNIKVPKTPKNVLTMDFLGVVGNTSTLPYNKNKVHLYVGNNAIVYNGYCVITSTDEFYNLTVYDGAIDLYKAIENITLADLAIEEIDHTKNLDSVLSSFTSDLKYKYIVADYNGKAQYSSTGSTTGTTVNDTINIDYLVPASKITYLLDKTFEYANATYDGAIFDTTDFKDTYISYLRKTEGTTVNELIYSGGTANGDYSYGSAFGNTYFSNVVTVKHNKISGATGGAFEPNQVDFKVSTSGIYEITTMFSIYADVDSGGYYYANLELVPKILVNDVFYYPIVKNSNNVFGTAQIPLNAGDSFKIVATTNNGNILYPLRFGINDPYYPYPLWFQVNYKFVSTSSETSRKALSEFKVKEFLNEILWKYGLTIYKDKYRNHYTFKNLSDIINFDSNNIIDWSNKFLNFKSESYLYGSYAQSNTLALKYNTTGVNYDDGYLNVNNKNLDDSKIVIQSKLYAKEEEKTKNLGYDSNIYKYWDKEVNDKGEVTYKALSSRFYWLSFANKSYPTGRWFGSESQGTRRRAYIIPEEVNLNQSFSYSVVNYYSEFNRILDNAKIITVNMWLDYFDITDFDFSKMYYIKQLGSYFLVNKITNFQGNKPTSVELIRVR